MSNDTIRSAPDPLVALLDDARHIQTTLIRSSDAASNQSRYQASADALSRIQTHLIHEKAARDSAARAALDSIEEGSREEPDSTHRPVLRSGNHDLQIECACGWLWTDGDIGEPEGSDFIRHWLAAASPSREGAGLDAAERNALDVMRRDHMEHRERQTCAGCRALSDIDAELRLTSEEQREDSDDTPT